MKRSRPTGDDLVTYRLVQLSIMLHRVAATPGLHDRLARAEAVVDEHYDRLTADPEHTGGDLQTVERARDALRRLSPDQLTRMAALASQVGTMDDMAMSPRDLGLLW